MAKIDRGGPLCVSDWIKKGEVPVIKKYIFTKGGV